MKFNIWARASIRMGATVAAIEPAGSSRGCGLRVNGGGEGAGRHTSASYR